MSKVFISYRRSDTQMAAGRLRESLVTRFGAGAIFRDKDSIEGGGDWIAAIEEHLKEDAIVLVLIGPTWLSARDESGARRLDNPEDWNRVEIETALRLGRAVVPVLVDGADMPVAAQLPESLRPLTRSNALKLRDDDWDSDVERLSHVLETHGVATERSRVVAGPRRRGPRRIVLAACAAAFAVLLAAAIAFKTSAPHVQDVSGSWAMTHFNEDGSQHAGTLTLKQNSDQLTGRIVWAPRAVARDISNGVLKASTIEFEAIGPRGAKRVYRGELDAAGGVIRGAAQGGSLHDGKWTAVKQGGASAR